MCEKICYLPIELELDHGPFFGNLYNLNLPLSKELYDHIILSLKYEGDDQFLTKDSCTLKFHIKEQDNKIYSMTVRDINIQYTQFMGYPVPTWLLSKVLNTKNLVPRVNHKKVLTIECNYNLIRMEGNNIPKEIKKYFPWVTSIRREIDDEDVFHIYYGDMYTGFIFPFPSSPMFLDRQSPT